MTAISQENPKFHRLHKDRSRQGSIPRGIEVLLESCPCLDTLGVTRRNGLRPHALGSRSTKRTCGNQAQKPFSLTKATEATAHPLRMASCRTKGGCNLCNICVYLATPPDTGFPSRARTRIGPHQREGDLASCPLLEPGSGKHIGTAGQGKQSKRGNHSIMGWEANSEARAADDSHYRKAARKRPCACGTRYS